MSSRSQLAVSTPHLSEPRQAQSGRLGRKLRGLAAACIQNINSRATGRKGAAIGEPAQIGGSGASSAPSRLRVRDEMADEFGAAELSYPSRTMSMTAPGEGSPRVRRMSCIR